MIVCPRCGGDTQVTETRSVGNYKRRRRVCNDVACGGKVTTVEIAVPPGQRNATELSIVPTKGLLAMRDAVARMLAVGDEEDGETP